MRFAYFFLAFALCAATIKADFPVPTLFKQHDDSSSVSASAPAQVGAYCHLDIWPKDAIVDLNDDFAIDNAFSAWRVKYQKEYESDAELLSRREIFVYHLTRIQAHNAACNKPYSLRINKFSDLTKAEFHQLYLAPVRHIDIPEVSSEETNQVGNNTIPLPLNPNNPDALDWRNVNAVTDIKDQGQCGSCYSFSTIASVETAWFLKSKNLVALSESQIVDCSATPAYGNQGCDGGDMRMSMQYLVDTGFVDTEDAYPYQAWQDKCAASPANMGAKISSYYNVTTACDVCLENAVQNGTVSVGIDASSDDFQSYSDGVYEEVACSSTDLDHGVAVIGYNYETWAWGPGDVYWIVKNSWGSDWGDGGYIYMRKADNNDPKGQWYNMCGISTEATLAIV